MNSRDRRSLTVASVVVAACLLSGCTSYYQVTDPASGRTFYTTDVDQSKKGGFVEFTDAKTKAQVTLQSSEVTKISKDQYKAAVGSN